MANNLQPSMSGRRPPAAGRFAGRRSLKTATLLALPVLSALSGFTQSITNVLPPLAPPYGEMPVPFSERHGVAMILAIALGVLLGILILWLLLRPRPVPPLPPEVAARAILTKFLNQPETGSTLSKISQTLRQYIVEAFQLPPGERTTSDFFAVLTTNPKIGPALTQALTDFLRECDQQKFAPVNPNESAASQPMNAATRALDIVSMAEKQRFTALPPAGAPT